MQTARGFAADSKYSYVTPATRLAPIPPFSLPTLLPDLSIALDPRAIGQIDTFKSHATSDFATYVCQLTNSARKNLQKVPGFSGGPFVCVKKGFAVDIAAYITHVIDDGDSSGSLQPVISCAD